MAGGFVYNAIDQTEVATAEIYGKALADLIMKDPKVVAITADLAKSTKLGDVLKVCPERVINVGIAEQDMFGVAAGMAKEGLRPASYGHLLSERKRKNNRNTRRHIIRSGRLYSPRNR